MRPAAVAGSFYPAGPEALRGALDAAFAAARAPAPGATAPKAVVVPHAGYVYSGAVAASAYLRLVPARDEVTRVVLLGPNHRVPLEGMAVSSADAFATPLGLVTVDADARERALTVPSVQVNDAAHALEHSLEVQLPFVQAVLGDVAVLPVVVGECATRAVVALLDVVWGGPETVIVVSTDLSHYHRYDDAVALDRRTIAAIAALNPAAIATVDACGAYPLRGLLAAAGARRMCAEVLDVRNSGDTAGDRRSVVGYGAAAVA
ncbi:MAG TPA: AmmeMemoRadiSam system protein B [Acidimicrobiales bacterium]|nr:AmmeMemoRadiSam system protein B [Acidimicrobiales bacterium]